MCSILNRIATQDRRGREREGICEGDGATSKCQAFALKSHDFYSRDMWHAPQERRNSFSLPSRLHPITIAHLLIFLYSTRRGSIWKIYLWGWIISGKEWSAFNSYALFPPLRSLSEAIIKILLFFSPACFSNLFYCKEMILNLLLCYDSSPPGGDGGRRRRRKKAIWILGKLRRHSERNNGESFVDMR